MKRLKSQNKKVEKISGSAISKRRGGDCEQFPTFSFFHLTTNASYNFDFFKAAQLNERRITKEYLYDKIECITKKCWKDWLLEGKFSGCESMEFSRIYFMPKDIKLTKDETIYVFRFNSYGCQDARILGFKKDKCPIFYVIGYDFDYSAYNHG